MNKVKGFIASVPSQVWWGVAAAVGWIVWKSFSGLKSAVDRKTNIDSAKKDAQNSAIARLNGDASYFDADYCEGVANAVRSAIWSFLGLGAFWGFDDDIVEALNGLKNAEEVRYCCKYYKSTFERSLRGDCEEALNDSNQSRLVDHVRKNWF